LALTTLCTGASKKQLGKFAFFAHRLEIGLLTLRLIGIGRSFMFGCKSFDSVFAEDGKFEKGLVDSYWFFMFSNRFVLFGRYLRSFY